MSFMTFITRMNFYLIYVLEYIPLRIRFAFYDPNIRQKNREKRIEIAVVGDSISAGMCSSSFCLASKDNYAAYLAGKLGCDLTNLSYPFALGKDVLRQSQNAPESDVTIVFIGSNDAILARDSLVFGDELRKTIRIVKEKADHVIIIGLPNFNYLKNTKSRRCAITRMILFPLGIIVSDPDVAGRFEKFNKEIEKIAQEEAVDFVRIDHIEFGDKDLGSDCFHPSPMGQQRIAQEVYKVIKQVI